MKTECCFAQAVSLSHVERLELSFSHFAVQRSERCSRLLMSEARRKKSPCSQRYASSSARKQELRGYRARWSLSEDVREHYRSLKQLARTQEATSIDFPKTLRKSDREYLQKSSDHLGLCHKTYGREPNKVLSVWTKDTKRKSSAESYASSNVVAVESIPNQKSTYKGSVVGSVGYGQKRVLDDTCYEEKNTLATVSHGQESNKVLSVSKKVTTRKRFDESCASSNGVAVATMSDPKLGYEGQEQNKMSRVSKRDTTRKSFVEPRPSVHDIAFVTKPEQTSAHEGFVISAVDYGLKRVLGVTCYSEKSDLAQTSQKFLPCCIDIDIFDLDWQPAFENFAILGTINAQKNYNELRVFGIGDNQCRRMRACRIGLAITALWNGYFLEEPQHKALMPLMAMASAAFAAQPTIVKSSLSTMSGNKVEAKIVANSVSAANALKAYAGVESNVVRKVLPPPPPPWRFDVPQPPASVSSLVPPPPPPPHHSVPAPPLPPSVKKREWSLDEIDETEI